MTSSLYAILGVEADAEPEQIKRAWRMAARAHHPDLAGQHGWSAEETAEHEAQYRQAGAAYSVLANPVQRAEYDRELAAIRRAFRRQKQQEAEQEWNRHRRRPDPARPQPQPPRSSDRPVHVEDLARDLHTRRREARQQRLQIAQDSWSASKRQEREVVRDFTVRVLAEAMLRWSEQDMGLPPGSLTLDS